MSRSAISSRTPLSKGVLEIFYAEIEPTSHNAKLLREAELPFPERDSGYSRHLFLGVPGGGKTTLKRQLIGSHPKTDAFPATSVNRTTTFPVETIFRDGDYTAVVTFLSEHETRFEIEESVSAAIVRAATDGIDRTAKEFLEQSDMRFRLKYTLGDFTKDEGEDEDPYADLEQDSIEDEEPIADQDGNHAIVEGFVQRIWALAREYRRRVETEFGALDAMESDDRSGALDLIQAEAEVSDEYAKLVSDVLEELRDRFSIVNIGRYEKSTTGWPKLWRLDTGNRREFFSGLRFFAGISATRWGRLLTPLVNGIRIAGPFQPTWAEHTPPLVLIDTEGLALQWNREEPRMTTREALHQLVDQLPEDQVDLARHWLEDLRDAADADAPPLDAATIESLDRGLADVAEGRVKPLDQYERERGL